MARNWPALDVRGVDRSDLVLAILDDFDATAVEEGDSWLRAFFSSPRARDAARAALAERYAVESVDLPDDDWARRSQDNLTPVTVGRITILPSVQIHAAHPLAIVIPPSMAFGTGHHATTRLCLTAMQTLDLRGSTMLDAGTGSGILAIAAARLGAGEALGIDNDPDAVQAARDNLLLNPEAQHVVFEVEDLMTTALPQADIVTANLTGALVSRIAPTLARAVREDGRLIVSGVLTHEGADALAAFTFNGTRPIEPVWEAREEEWLCFVLRAGRTTA